MPALASLLGASLLLLRLGGYTAEAEHVPAQDEPGAGAAAPYGAPVLAIAADPVPASPRPVPASPTPAVSPRLRTDGFGVIAFGPLTPSVFHVRAGGATRTGAGLAFLSLTGRGWLNPAPVGIGETTRFGGSLAVVEGTLDERANALFWPIEGQFSKGARGTLGAGYAAYGLVGFDGLLRMSTTNEGAQHQRAHLHVPELSVGLSRKAREVFWELGPLGGLVAVGRHRLALHEGPTAAGPGTYGLRPYAGALASLVTTSSVVTVDAHRAWLAGGESQVDERLRGMLCHAMSERRDDSGFGGCVTADIAHARVNGRPELWSYEITFRVGMIYLPT